MSSPAFDQFNSNLGPEQNNGSDISTKSSEQLLSSEELTLIERSQLQLLYQSYLTDASARIIILRHPRAETNLILVHNSDPILRIANYLVTLPQNSTGTRHILEHALLSSSDSLQVSEVFEEMLRSLSLVAANAVTKPDCTGYWAASKDPKTLFKVGKIYFDCLTQPTLTRDIFLRECGTLKPDPADPTKLTFSGVVYNEMKSVFDNPIVWTMFAQQRILFEGTAYANISGGDPEQMINLIYDQFLADFKREYGTANINSFLYGNLKLEDAINFWNSSLKGIKNKGKRLLVPDTTPDQKSPTAIRAPYPYYPNPITPIENAFRYTIAWRSPKIQDFQEAFELRVLASMLSNSEYSPISKAHKASGLKNLYQGASSGACGTSNLFSIRFTDCAEPDIDKSLALIGKQLANLVDNGFSNDTIQATLKSREYTLLLLNCYPDVGADILGFVFNAVKNSDSLSELKLDTESLLVRVDKLRTKLRAGEKVFEELIEKYLLSNLDRTEITFVPDLNLKARWEQRQQQLIEDKISAHGETAFEYFSKQAERLEELENQRFDLNAITQFPLSTISDTNRIEQEFPTSIHNYGDAKIFHTDIDTKGLHNISLVFDISDLEPSKLCLIGLLTEFLLARGPASCLEGEFQNQLQKLSTGAISHTATQDSTGYDPNQEKLKAQLTIDLCVTEQDLPEALELLVKAFGEMDQSAQELFTLVTRQKLARIRSSRFSTDTILKMLSNRLSAGLSNDSYRIRTAGLEYKLKALTEILDQASSNWSDLATELQSLCENIFQQNRLVVNTGMPVDSWHKLRPAVEHAIDQIPCGSIPNPEEAKTSEPSKSVAVTIPITENFVGQAMRLKSVDGTTYTNHGCVHVCVQLMNRYLNQEIRRKGNAYGAGANYRTQSGKLFLLSWRDNNILRTYDSYNQLDKFLKDTVNLDLLNRAKVSVVNLLNKPQAPQEMSSLLLRRSMGGIKTSDIELIRNQVMDTTLEEVKEFAEILAHSLKELSIRVVYGSEDAIAGANKQGLGLPVESAI